MSAHTDMAYSQAAKRRETERRAQKMPLIDAADRAVAGPYWKAAGVVLLLVNAVLWTGLAAVTLLPGEWLAVVL